MSKENVEINIWDSKTCKLQDCVGQDKSTNILTLSRIKGLVEVGKYIFGNGYYSNKIVGIIVDNIPTDSIFYQESVVLPNLDKPVGIKLILEDNHPKDKYGHDPCSFVSITGIVDEKIKIPEFRTSKSN